MLLLIGACDGGEDAPTTNQPPAATAPEAEASAEEVATGFLEAYGALDVGQAMTYLADDAVIQSLGGQNDLRLLVSWLKATGYQQILHPCEEPIISATGTRVFCAFDFHALRSGELGLGPYTGSTFVLVIRGGEIAEVGQSWAFSDEFSPEVWEPFADWVSTTYPEDAAAMYVDGSLTNVQLSEESIRLWQRNTREYVEEVGAGA